MLSIDLQVKVILNLKLFLSDFDDLLKHYYFITLLATLILDECNARYSCRWKGDKTMVEGTHLEALTFLHNSYQIIWKPTHLLLHSNFCIDLIYTDQQSVVANCVHTPLKILNGITTKLHILNWTSIFNIHHHRSG